MDADRNSLLLSASNPTILSSLERLNDYIQKHYDQFVAHESLKRILLVSSFAEKERGYERQIATLKAIHTDIAALLLREQANTIDLREKLDNVTNSIAGLRRVVTDAGFTFVDRRRVSHEVKQEEGSQESMGISDISICPNAAISSLLSQIEAVFVEMNGRSVPPPAVPLPCYSIIEALGKVVDSLLATQRTFALLREDFKSVDAARADAGRQNQSLQEKIALLQEELKQVRDDNDRISRELVAGTVRCRYIPNRRLIRVPARLEREEHVCRQPTPPCPIPGNFIPRVAAPAESHSRPATQDEFPVSLPSPPLEKRDFLLPDG